jgi:hypothetical protein
VIRATDLRLIDENGAIELPVAGNAADDCCRRFQGGFLLTLVTQGGVSLKLICPGLPCFTPSA